MLSYVVGFTLYFFSLAFYGMLSAVPTKITLRKGAPLRDNLLQV
jgi:hypothetical protein